MPSANNITVTSQMSHCLHCLLVLSLLLVTLNVSAEFIKVSPSSMIQPATSANTLCQQSQLTKDYIEQHLEDVKTLGTGLPDTVTLSRIIETLNFICAVAKHDALQPNINRLTDTEFLTQHFEFFRWKGNTQQIQQAAKTTQRAAQKKRLLSVPEGNILLTKYYVKRAEGSSIKTTKYNQALFALPDDEENVSDADIEASRSSFIRYQHTRQAIFSGVLDGNPQVRPLAWVETDVMHDILMQGTVVLTVDGNERIFNVHKNNGIRYQYHKESHEQSRYWYFKPTEHVLGYGVTTDNKLPILPQVTVAADIRHLGLGSLFILQNRDAKFSHLVLTGDTGGAFENNHFQLDWLLGYFHGWKEFKQANRSLPAHVDVYLMVKK